MSLRLKTILGVAFIEAILLVLLVSMTLDYLRSTNYEGMVKRASTTATLFATTTKDAVLSYDLASLDAFVNEVMRNPDLVYARVLGPDQELFAQAGEEALLARPFIADTDVSTVTDGIFDTFALIVEGGEEYGQVQLGLDISSLNAKIEEAQRWSAALAAIEMGLVALFSFLLGAYLTKQLGVLQGAARDIADGKLDIELPVRGKDEIAEVALAFNTMVHNLREAGRRRDEYEAQLNQLNKSLEQRVEQRTQDLERKNLDLEQANQAIKETQAKLMHSEKMASVGVLAAGVAHEINNPIGFVLSNVRTLDEYVKIYHTLLSMYEALLDIQDPVSREAKQAELEQYAKEQDIDFVREDIEDLLKDAIDGAQRVGDIVRNLKSFSHAEQETEFKPHDLNECIRTTLKMADNQLKYHCKVMTDLGDLPDTYCSPGQINQVLLNLLVNAGQAIEGSGAIKVTSRYDGENIEIRVTDTGKGIEQEAIKKLFDPFYTTKPVGEGTGLGLSISYGIIKEHQGEILVQSKVGAGTSFTLVLPHLIHAPA
ncbi:ATP-binding protein [Pontibacterium granulatum]|uniref:sensor histidine kinase n=1 Tax=Pontibacterium granulatum TaxID=2036029 RepID=UPI00249CCAB3|nr:ATP-binding protein [Pontibacterium granulatum]MDI3324949.1 ATP-binding protein [Pontibacterium granulatum]